MQREAGKHLCGATKVDEGYPGQPSRVRFRNEPDRSSRIDLDSRSSIDFAESIEPAVERTSRLLSDILFCISGLIRLLGFAFSADPSPCSASPSPPPRFVHPRPSRD